MKKAIIIGSFSLFVIAFTACSGSNTAEKNNASTTNEATSDKPMASSVVYTCTMHPEVISDKPGSCPKCGMDLVKKEMSKDSSMQHMDMKMDSMHHDQH